MAIKCHEKLKVSTEHNTNSSNGDERSTPLENIRIVCEFNQNVNQDVGEKEIKDESIEAVDNYEESIPNRRRYNISGKDKSTYSKKEQVTNRRKV